MCRKVKREISKPFGFAYRREGRIDPYVHNNPPEILHSLSLIFPLLKLIIVPCRSVCDSFFVWYIHICYSLKNSLSEDRLFFIWEFGIVKINFLFSIYKQTDAQPKKIDRPGPKKGGRRKEKTAARRRKKITPSENKNIGAPIKK